MNPSAFIPTPDTIPAPWWVFEVLGVVTFLVHILFINVVFGGAILIIYSRVQNDHEANGTSILTSAISSKLPSIFALTVTFGVAPLLFLQVNYGHLFYSSSILLSWWWFIIIPFVILAYYGLYVHVKQAENRIKLSRAAIILAAELFLYIGFLWVNNNTLMIRPEHWQPIFEQRSWIPLHFGEPTLIPRWLHFICASIAIAGLFTSIVWNIRTGKAVEGAEHHIRTGLKIFAWSTIVQILAGFWWLIALPRPIMMQFMSHDILRTALLTLGILLAVSLLIQAFKGKLTGTIIHLAVIMVIMVTMRALLRASYLADYMRYSDLELNPQYDVLALFLIVFAAGLGAVWYMVKAVRNTETGRVEG